MKINLTADKLKIYGPKEDGGFKIELGIGAYEKEKLKEVISFDPGRIIEVTLEQKKRLTPEQVMRAYNKPREKDGISEI